MRACVAPVPEDTFFGFRPSYLKVTEFQRRGLVHFHAVLRTVQVGIGAPRERRWLGADSRVIARKIEGQVGVVPVDLRIPIGTSRNRIMDGICQSLTW